MALVETFTPYAQKPLYGVETTDEFTVTRDMQKLMDAYTRETATRILDWLSDWNKKRPASQT